ncbi:MAG: oligosaccharide flippase family protein [Verrucomicrobiota bacterium]
MNRKLLRNTTAYMIAGMLPFAVNFFMLPVYTRYMEPADYGILSVMTTVSSLLTGVVGFQMGSSFTRLYFDFEPAERPRLFSSVVFALLGLNVLLLLPMHLAGPAVTRAIFPVADFTYNPYVLLVLITVFFGSLSVAGASMLRVQEKGRTMMRISIITTLAGVVFGVYFVVIRKMGAHGALLAGTFSAGLNAIYLCLANRALFTFAFDLSIIKQSLAYSLPIIPHTLGAAVFMYADKYILTYFATLAAIGLYGVADKISMILNVMVNAFKDAYIPNFMKQAKEDRAHAVASCREVMLIWTVMTSLAFLGISLFSREVLIILTPEKYHDAWIYIPILSGAYIFKGLYGFAVMTILYEKKTILIPLCTFAGGIFNVVFNILLIPIWGVVAAAWTTIGAHALTWIVAIGFSRRYFPLSYQWGRMTLLISLAVGIYFLLDAWAPPSLWLGLAVKGAGFLAAALVFLRIGRLTPATLVQTVRTLLARPESA